MEIVFRKRRIYDNVFLEWSPTSAYLLGQFKAGANFQKDRSGISISTTDLQHLIKLQILLRSDHKIWFDHKIKQRYVNGSARYQFHFRNKYIIHDLGKRGFIAHGKKSAKLEAPFPEDLPKELFHHYLRGFFDERGGSFKDSNSKPVFKVFYASEDFLLKISEMLTDLLGIPLRKIHKHKGHESYYMRYTGSQVAAIFKFLYFFEVPKSLYCTKKYNEFCQALGYEEDYEKIDVELDLQALYLLHTFCTMHQIDPEQMINRNLGRFLDVCKRKNLLPDDKETLIKEGRDIALQFNYGTAQTDWLDIFSSLYGLIHKDIL